MALIFALLIGAAAAQSYRFPVADEHYGYFYPTAYIDEGGADWGCGSIFYSGHQGSDFGGGSWAGMDEGRNIVAAAEGVVVAAHDGEYDRCSSGDCGTANYVIIQHADGRQTWYWHLKQWSVGVSNGQGVSCGTYLGQMGSSGNSTGPHIHFEVREPSGGLGEPFDGPCAGPPSYWISQGDYGGLPGGSCPWTEPCNQVATLSCGQTISTANNAGGATASHSVYGCGDSTWSGPEIAFSFSTPIAEPVSIGLTGLSTDLDLFLLGSNTCDGSGAVTCSTNGDASDEWVSFDASAGGVYTVVVDGWSGGVSNFNLSASCVGGTPDPGESDGSVDGDPTTPGDTSTLSPDDPAWGREGGKAPGKAVPWDQTATGCAQSPGAARGLFGLVGLAALLRRSSRGPGSRGR